MSGAERVREAIGEQEGRVLTDLETPVVADRGVVEVVLAAASEHHGVLACIAHQHWAPEGTAYTQRREITFGQPITAETIPGLTVTLPE